MKCRYLVLRSLFDKAMYFKLLESETELQPLELLKALSTLISTFAIKKRIIRLNSDTYDIDLTELGIAKSLLGIENMPMRKKTFYIITNKGKNQLAFYEYKYQLYKLFNERYHSSLNQPYFDEIQKIIEENNHFKS